MTASLRADETQRGVVILKERSESKDLPANHGNPETQKLEPAEAGLLN